TTVPTSCPRSSRAAISCWANNGSDSNAWTRDRRSAYVEHRVPLAPEAGGSGARHGPAHDARRSNAAPSARVGARGHRRRHGGHHGAFGVADEAARQCGAVTGRLGCRRESTTDRGVSAPHSGANATPVGGTSPTAAHEGRGGAECGRQPLKPGPS